MNVYFDNAATTCVRSEAAEIMMKVMTEDFGNPSSTHSMGRKARTILDTARKNIADAVGAAPSEIFFTSGGTEADNWAILGTCEKLWRKGKHIVISGYEHDAINSPVKKLEDQGWVVSRVMPDKDGHITVQAVSEVVRKDTVLVSVMLVNNEIGAVNEIAKIAKAVKAKSEALVHTDAVQAFCKMPISVKSLGVDLMSLSSHKIHGPKGCGALFVKNGVKLPALIMGGGQEESLRSGTEALPAIAGFGEAARLGKAEMPVNVVNMRNLKEFLVKRIAEEIPETVFIGSGDAPHIISISLPKYKSEVLMNYLDREGICVSKSSACKKGKRSHVLEAMGLSPQIIDGAIRISFSKFSTIEECEYFVKNLKSASEKVLKVL
ncbi:MAG: cysteine desulfurase [Oscillospiraceae bacterium]|nr:cysteine desulfurase [Oscillospiraceae bacterium]